MELTNIGTMTLDKGVIRKGHKLFAWDAIQDCSASNCIVVDKCNYIKKGKCAVHVDYLKTLCDTICSSYKYLDEMQYFKIGMQIIPLYSHLLRLKLLEMSISSVEYSNNKGVRFIHPVFKEIRNTLVTIHLMWKDLGMKPAVPDIPNPSQGEKEGEKGNIVDGDPDYYESLTKKNENPIRKRRVR